MIIGERTNTFNLNQLDHYQESLYKREKRNYDHVIAEGVVPSYGREEKPFRLREAMLTVRRLGRPLTEEEYKLFEGDFFEMVENQHTQEKEAVAKRLWNAGKDLETIAIATDYPIEKVEQLISEFSK